MSHDSHRGSPASISGQYMWSLWWKKWHWESSFSEYFVSPDNIVTPVLHTHLLLHAALTSRQTGEVWEHSNKRFHLVFRGTNFLLIFLCIPFRSVAKATSDSFMKRCGYTEGHLVGAVTTAILNTRNGNWHEVRVCHFQCIFKARILSANHNRTFQGHAWLQQQ